MKKFLRSTFAIVISLLVIGAGQFNHVYAVQDSSRMGPVKDGATSSMTHEQYCQMSCMGPTVQEANKNIKKKDNKDTEPRPPYYVQFTGTYIEGLSKKLEKSTAVEPYPKIPIYKLCNVVRR